MTSTAQGTIFEPQAVYDLLREIVAEKGEDYVYPQEAESGTGTTCFYVRDGQPDCLIGRLLHRLGVSIAELMLSEGGSAHTVVPSTLGINALASDNEALIAALNQAQRAQDSGETWGSALGRFVYRLGEFGVTVR